MKLSSLIGHSAEVMDLIIRDERPADLVINHFFRSRKYLGSRDRAFIAESVYHAFRNRRRLEWLWERFEESQSANAKGGAIPSSHPSPLSHPSHISQPMAVFVLSLLEGATQEETERVAAALAERDDAAGGEELAHAARRFLDQSGGLPWPADPAARLALECSLPDWLVDCFIRMLGEKEARELAESCNDPAPVTLRINPMKAPREAVAAALAAEGFPCGPTRWSPLGLTLRERANVFTSEAFKRGWFEIQDEASQIVALCVDPKPGSRVLDACAGGGGKALHLSAIMKGRGEIVALDVVKRRLDSLRDRARRNDCQNIRIRLVGAGDPPASDLIGTMNYVLIDAPCTGMGVLRRNPDARWKVTPETVRELCDKQRGLLERYAACVAPGGRLVYATCSVLRDENENVVEAFLAAHSEFHPGDARGILSRYGLGELLPEGGPYLRLWPHRHGTDGFFVAVMERETERT